MRSSVGMIWWMNEEKFKQRLSINQWMRAQWAADWVIQLPYQWQICRYINTNRWFVPLALLLFQTRTRTYTPVGLNKTKCPNFRVISKNWRINFQEFKNINFVKSNPRGEQTFKFCRNFRNILWFHESENVRNILRLKRKCIYISCENHAEAKIPPNWLKNVSENPNLVSSKTVRTMFAVFSHKWIMNNFETVETLFDHG
jgi:hypothetical protein